MDFLNTLLDQCDSTNAYAKNLALQGCPSGTWISAKTQTQGRGRSGHIWTSDEGNLFLSMVFRLPVSFFPRASVFAAYVLADQLRKKGCPVHLKWPNDVLAGQKKLAGVLCESVIGKNPFLVVGIGLNCLSAPEGGVHLTELLKKPVHADQIRLEVVSWMLDAFSQIADFTLDLKDPLWQSCRPGAFVYFIREDAKSAESGLVLSINAQHELVIRQGKKLVRLRSENVRNVRFFATPLKSD